MNMIEHDDDIKEKELFDEEIKVEAHEGGGVTFVFVVQ